MQKLIRLVGFAYESFAQIIGKAECGLLLAIRLYWGIQFMQDGWGKLTHLSRVTEFFTSLNLPAPHLTALAVASIEFVGGILFACGIASRLISLILFINMTMAYLSVPDDRINFSHILSNPSDFYNATPYTYWLAALLILILGPGWVSIDTLIKRWFNKSYKA